MRFILMMHVPAGTGDYNISSWTAEELTAHLDFMRDLNGTLSEAGELVSAEGLAPPRDARIVRAGRNGTPIVTDGPFAETKEFLAGFWILEVDRPERAYEIAAHASSAPGPGGEPLIIPIEVRPIGAPPA